MRIQDAKKSFTGQEIDKQQNAQTKDISAKPPRRAEKDDKADRASARKQGIDEMTRDTVVISGAGQQAALSSNTVKPSVRAHAATAPTHPTHPVRLTQPVRPAQPVQPVQPAETAIEAQTPAEVIEQTYDRKAVMAEREQQKAEKAQRELEQMESDKQMMMQQLKSANEQGDAMSEEMEKRIKCMQIAMRIMTGDNVPDEDYRYLAENDTELYAKAVSLRMENEDPTEYDRLSEDEQNQKTAEEGVHSIENAQSALMSGGADGARTSSDGESQDSAQ